MKKWLAALLALVVVAFSDEKQPMQFIRINQLGYTPTGNKVAVWCSLTDDQVRTFRIQDIRSGKIVFNGSTGKAFGAYGPFLQSYRLDFSALKQPGKYKIISGKAESPVFEIGNDVYKGSADFCLRYMRQQRSGFNPFLKDSCHTKDGYTLYGEKAGIKDSTFIDVTGGWHDASDYLQYSTTSANATYHLLMAYRDFPKVFGDEKLANGLTGSNGRADVLDEAKWGLDWLLKMHPNDEHLFNQIGDDRDHISMRIPKLDSQYGKGFERPVYLVNGEPQQRGKFMNNTTGTSSTAAKFASAFALGSSVLANSDNAYADVLFNKSISASLYAFKKMGVTQTASVKAPYIYAEDNWVDDMELHGAALYNSFKQQKIRDNNHPWRYNQVVDTNFLSLAYKYAKQEPITPWLGTDTAKHYQWYPFINLGHYELAKQLPKTDKRRDTLIGFYKKGIDLVWNKAKQNAFYRGVPFIWCSNNLTVSFAIQCYWYRQLTNDISYIDLEQANIDWLFGLNPWGTSMVYGLPSFGDTPTDPHSAFTHLKNYPIDGGLIDGPVYTSIYQNLIGIKLYQPDEYAAFQSNLAVYHDDYGDYSTNEPTMDGTASLIYLLAAQEAANKTFNKQKPLPIKVPVEQVNNGWTAIPPGKLVQTSQGAIIKAYTTKKEIALVFTGHEFGEGLPTIMQTLAKEKVKASFFFTGDFYRNTAFQKNIKQLQQANHYLGPHSDKHLLYCDWKERNKLLVSYKAFDVDLTNNFKVMDSIGINIKDMRYFIPPYEWWNDSVATWSDWKGLKLFSFTPGTYTNADYTWPEMGGSYKENDYLLHHLKAREIAGGLNGDIILIHAGTDPRRKEKLYDRLPELIKWLKKEGYAFKRIDDLLD